MWNNNYMNLSQVIHKRPPSCAEKYLSGTSLEFHHDIEIYGGGAINRKGRFVYVNEFNGELESELDVLFWYPFRDELIHTSSRVWVDVYTKNAKNYQI